MTAADERGEGQGGRAMVGGPLEVRGSLCGRAWHCWPRDSCVWGRGYEVCMDNRALMSSWRKTKWRIIQRSDFTAILWFPSLLKKKKKIISRVYLFHGWKSGEQDVRAVCQLSGREITNSFISEVREPGLLLSKKIASWRKHCRHKEERDSAGLSWQVAHLILFFNWFLSWRLLVSFLPRSLKLASCMIIESH